MQGKPYRAHLNTEVLWSRYHTLLEKRVMMVLESHCDLIAVTSVAGCYQVPVAVYCRTYPRLQSTLVYFTMLSHWLNTLLHEMTVLIQFPLVPAVFFRYILMEAGMVTLIFQLRFFLDLILFSFCIFVVTLQICCILKGGYSFETNKV